MALSAILVLLILAIGYFQSIHGLFSALLNCVVAIVCAALSFATYEYIAVNFLSQFKPDFALGLSLVGMFIVPMTILRVLLDQFVHRTCLLPMIADKAGGFVFGLIGGYVMVGMLALGLQMIPFGNGFLGFKRVDLQEPMAEQNELWLQPDRFTVNLASLLSGGVMSGAQSFNALHPDFVTEIGWIEAVPWEAERDRRGVRRFAPPGSITAPDGYEIVQYVFRKKPQEGQNPPQYEPKGADAGKQFIRVRFRVDSAAADADRQHRYTPFQIRLVGERGGRVEQYHAIAVGDSDDPDKSIYAFPGRDKVDPVVNKLLGPDAQANIAAVFEVPERFKPRFVEYKGGARAVLVEGKPKPPQAPVAAAEPATPIPPTPAPTPPPPRGPRPGGERVGGVRVAGSFFGDNLPVTMTAYTGSDEEIDNPKQALKQGHLRGNLADQGEKKEHPPVAKFEVPADKRLLHLNMENLRARSSLGRALSFAVKTVQNYLVHDEQGRQYKAVGVYAIANVDGSEQVEVIYFPEHAEMSSRGLPSFSKIKDSHLERNDYTYVFLYLIEPGAKLVKFSTGARASSSIDLKEFNLTAPP